MLRRPTVHLVLALVLASAAPALLAGCGRADETTGRRGSVLPVRLEPDPAFLKEGDSRTFSITYTAHVQDVPAGTKRLRVWVPLPPDTTVQRTSDLVFYGQDEPRLTTENTFGNRLAFYEIAHPESEWETRVSYTVTRKEARLDLDALATDGQETDPRVKAYLRPDALVVVDDRVRRIAAEATRGISTTLGKARALYDYVALHMAYDKSGTGWGRGDTSYACDAGKGNCTDFHSLFISLCRAAGTPAGFAIGLFAPYGPYDGQPLGGYHCWAWFRVPGKSWVPVDISEGWKDGGKRLDYCFGNQTSNRVTLSIGRDLVLVPKQAGGPLNYLLAPYAEADGKPVPTSKDWAMRDVE